MSGGVDSSVTAKLLADQVRQTVVPGWERIIMYSGPFLQDYDLSAVFMRNWDTRDESGTDQGCEWKKDWEDVQQVCRMLGIKCQMVRYFHY